MAENTMHGNRALLKLNGETFAAGTIQSVSVADNFGLQDVSGLGDAEVVEHIPGLVTHSINLERVFIYNKNLFRQGFVPNSTQYINPPSMELEILDKVTGETLEHYTGVKVESYDRTYGKHALSVERVSLRARHKEV